MVCDSCSLTNAIIFGVIGYFIYIKLWKSSSAKKKPKILKEDFKKDVVYLYQFPRNNKCPNLSPFCLKLETIFRIYNIPYQIVSVLRERSRNGQLPFVELNGEHIADSDLIEMRVKQHFKVASLSDEQEAHSVALSRFADNHLFCLLIRLKHCDNFYKTLLKLAGAHRLLMPIILPLIRTFIGRKIRQRSIASIGDIDDSELEELLHRDLRVVENSIRGKFIFGDQITSADAALFGQLATVYYPFQSRITEILDANYPKIVNYLERIKLEVFPNDFTK